MKLSKKKVVLTVDSRLTPISGEVEAAKKTKTKKANDRTEKNKFKGRVT